MSEITFNSTENEGIKRVALLVACLASFFTPFMGTSVNIALPIIGANLGSDAIILNWVMYGFILTDGEFK